jgi:4-amino-4-deoxy-L-arabinose transferase-like glycosyltransferase
MSNQEPAAWKHAANRPAASRPIKKNDLPPYQRRSPMRVWIGQYRVILSLTFLCIWFGMATLPYLANSPPLEAAQMGIAAPAYKLASQGVYGNDLFTGFYHTEQRNYEYMPLYPLFVALSFKGFGLGVFQARLVSVLCGLATLLLTYRLGQRLYDCNVGLVAAAFLCVVRLGIDWQPPEWPKGILYLSNIPLIDFARVLRYDIMVPVWVLASCLAFLRAYQHPSRLRYLAVGVLVGLATLSHVYGAFILAVLLAVLLWQDGIATLRRAPIYWIVGGWLLVLSPWLLYVAQDLNAYRGQMLRHEARFDLLNPTFYWENLRFEYKRYFPWLGNFPEQTFRPHLGFWLMVIGVLAANLLLVRRLWYAPRLADRLLFLTLPLLGGLLGMLINLKRYPYTVLVLPFLALETALALITIGRWTVARSGRWRWLWVLIGLAVLIEGGFSAVRSLARAQVVTPYRAMTQALKAAVPPGARVLMMQTYWLGWSEYEVRSLDLAFVLSNPQYGYTQTPTLAQVLDTIDPAYVVIEDYFLHAYHSTNVKAVQQFTELAHYLAQHCGETVATVSNPDYETIRVYRCQ